MSDNHGIEEARPSHIDRNGSAERHAKTHDVRREELTNPVGPQVEDPSFAAQLAPVDAGPGGHAAESTPAVQDKDLHNQFPEFTSDELARLQVLEPGTRLEQGGTYIDLNRLGDGPFKALGGHEVSTSDRYVAKRDTDYELWNRLVTDDRHPVVERPDAGEE